MSRFDHAPSLPPFGELGPGHGADAACLWARVPRFAARPLLGRAGAGMSIADIRAARALQQAVLRFADGGSPAAQTHTGWVPYSRSSRRTALFSESVTVVDDPAAERRQAWGTAATPGRLSKGSPPYPGAELVAGRPIGSQASTSWICRSQ